MKYALTAALSKEIDEVTINKIGIPSLVLMEKAAMGVCAFVKQNFTQDKKILAVCGPNNNGADGIATARLLVNAGYQADVILFGDRKKASKENKQQLRIAKNSGVKVVKKLHCEQYDCIIDALFGVGLNRPITGELYKKIEQINDSKKPIVSVDIPSGISCDDGKVMGIAIKANVTVTFGFTKIGLCLYPGAEYAGKTIIWDIGTSINSLNKLPETFYFDETPQVLLPQRKADSNKGTYGKVLVIAGSKNMSGAAYFAAAAAYRVGAGLVRVLTVEENREVMQKQLPEAILTTYQLNENGNIKEEFFDTIVEAVNWASVILLGPGLSQNAAAATLVNYCLQNVKVSFVVDADAINIIAKLITEKVKEDNTVENRIRALNEMLPSGTVLTPHKMELSRLTGISLGELATGMISVSKNVTAGNDFIFVKKDVRTIVSFGDVDYINITGNDGMATAGSGDVLGGIIAGIIAQGETPKNAAMTGCFIHGWAGDLAATRLGNRSMLASDILEAIPETIKK